MVDEARILEALNAVMDPELGRSLVELGMIRDVKIQGSDVEFTLALTTLACPLKDRISGEAEAAVKALDGVDSVTVNLGEMSQDEKQKAFGMQKGEKPLAETLNDIHHVVAVMSGKGGVGKSLVAGLLAVALRRKGLRVGVLDADITGPSIPKMFFSKIARPQGAPVGIIPPQTSTGIKVMSINLILSNEDDAVIWRGPLVSGAIKQFWGEVFWGDLDYLIVDLPPGTSDASLTVMQSMPLSGVVLVTSPQNLAGMVVRKAAQMAEQLNIPVLGLVENMSYFVAPDTGTRYDLFGPSHAKSVAQKVGTEFLGSLPIDPRIAVWSDEGHIEESSVEAFDPIVEKLLKVMPEGKCKPVFK